MPENLLKLILGTIKKHAIVYYIIFYHKLARIFHLNRKGACGTLHEVETKLHFIRKPHCMHCVNSHIV